MSQNIGTLLSAPIRPNDSLDLIASAFANEIKGGHHGYATLAERNSLIVERREWGMLVTVYNDGANNGTYQLKYNYVDIDLSNNSNWVDFSSSSSAHASEWYDSVKTRTNIEPATSSVGDRFLVTSIGTGAWFGNENKIAEWVSSLTWSYTSPKNGGSVRVDDERDSIYRYDGTFPSGVWTKELITQVRYITATGSGLTFSATTTPDIISYSSNVLYMTNFQINNIAGSASININNLGNVMIKKHDGLGSLIDLSPQDIRSGIIYQLVYDGTNFQTSIPALAPQQISSNIRVSAFGTDSYSGSATPSIATYSAGDLYLVDFNNSNTGATAATLNINGLGAYEIIKFDESGPISLTGGGEIVSGQTYYITWDGSNFQLYDFNPQSSSQVTYTNPAPVPTTIGGIVAGMTFSNVTMKQMWDLLLYPYQQSNFTAFTFNYGASPREVGNSIPGGSYNFTWNISYPANVSPNTIKIKDTTTGSTLISGTANDGIAQLTIGTVSHSSPATHTWQISAVRTNSTSISSTRSVVWYWRMFYGTQSATSLTASGVQSLSNQSLSPSRTGTYNFSAEGYKYFAWPTSFGAPALFRDFNTNLAVAMAGIEEGYMTSVGSYYAQTVSVTNAYGISTNYYVFRSQNVLGGAISIVVT